MDHRSNSMFFFKIDGPNGAILVAAEQASIHKPRTRDWDTFETNFDWKEANSFRTGQHPIHRQHTGGCHELCHQLGGVGRTPVEN